MSAAKGRLPWYGKDRAEKAFQLAEGWNLSTNHRLYILLHLFQIRIHSLSIRKKNSWMGSGGIHHFEDTHQEPGDCKPTSHPPLSQEAQHFGRQSYYKCKSHPGHWLSDCIIIYFFSIALLCRSGLRNSKRLNESFYRINSFHCSLPEVLIIKIFVKVLNLRNHW